MDIDRVFSIGAAIDTSYGEYWKKKIEMTLTEEYCLDHCINLGDIILSIYAFSHDKKEKDCDRFVAYGAGKMAKLYLPQLMKKCSFIEVWDAYSSAKEFNGLDIVRPVAGKENIKIIVFIDDYEVRNRATKMLRDMGYEDVYYYRYYLCLTHSIPKLEGLEQHLTEKTTDVLEEIEKCYRLINSEAPSVLYAALPVNLSNEKFDIKSTLDGRKIEDLYDRLCALLLLKQKKSAILKYIKNLIEDIGNEKFSIAYRIELFLRMILQGGVKTKERPIKMFRDFPYDPFAVYETLKVLIEWMAVDIKRKLEILGLLLSLNNGSTILKSLETYFLCEANKYEEALELARKTIHVAPNSLLASEIFYTIAKACTAKGIVVEEPIPNYNLDDYFCWSGINFAWCGGYDRESDKAELSPCFRPLQCSARPEGDFWSGDDWKEFRKSLMDGSFRYCQKDQCPNLVAGWLPRKDRIKDEKIREIIKGNFNVIPTLEELHFSYDEHCNLKCPSCRTEFQTITIDQASEFDLFYEKHLKKLVKNAKHLCLSGCGEAMISPHSRKILQSLNSEEYPDIEVELRTNMTTITPEAWKRLGEGRKVIRHIAASIDSSRKDDFERLRYPAKWENVCQNLKFVQKLRNNGELDMFEFHVVIQKDNVDQLLEIIKMAISYDADAVTFSRLINWREMPESEYNEINPFWVNNKYHKRLMEEIDNIRKFREQIENGTCDLNNNGKKIYINMHFEPDPNERYDEIRYGTIKIR